MVVVVVVVVVCCVLCLLCCCFVVMTQHVYVHKKSRDELATLTDRRKNAVHHHASQPREAHGRSVEISWCEQRNQDLN